MTHSTHVDCDSSISEGVSSEASGLNRTHSIGMDNCRAVCISQIVSAMAAEEGESDRRVRQVTHCLHAPVHSAATTCSVN